jgi:hypothetical protein
MKARTLAAALTLIFCLSASARATDYYCTTSSQLTTALANAVGGDTITLQAGNTYTYSNNVLYRAPSTLPSGYPTTSDWYETSSSPLGWNDAANSDYSLSSGQKVMRVVIDSSNSPASTNLGSIKRVQIAP